MKIISFVKYMRIVYRFLLFLIFFQIIFCTGNSSENENDNSWLTDESSADNAGSTTIDKGVVHFGTTEYPVSIQDTIGVKEKHVYHFEGLAGGIVRIELRANNSNIDSALAIILPDGSKVSPSSWQNADGKDAVCDNYELPLDGEYRIIATTYRMKTGGAYTLILICLDGVCEKEEPKPWIPELRSISSEDAYILADSAWKVQFVEPDGYHQRRVAWAWIQENCNRRASMVNFALSQGKIPSILPLPISEQLAQNIVQNPSYDSAQIFLTGPLHIQQQYVLSDGTKTDFQSPTSWDHHIAAVINIEGTLMVIDPSLKREPVTIDEWIHSYIVSGLECPLVNEDLYREINSYYLLRSQFNREKPGIRCAHTFMKPFSLRPDEELTSQEVIDELEGARSLLYSNSEYLRTTLHELTGRNITTEELGLVTSNLIPMDDPEYCAAVNYSPRWCAEFRP